jgi:hypothetical protein
MRGHEHLYGRNAGDPAPPVQSRTCRCPASGSSVVRAAAVQSRVLMRTPLCWLCPAGRGAAGGPVQQCPAEVSCAGGVLPSRPSPCRGLAPPLRTTREKTPQGACGGRLPPPCGSRGASQWGGASMVPCPGCPFCAARAVYHALSLPPDRSCWGLPSAATPLCRHAMAAGLRRTSTASPLRRCAWGLRERAHPRRPP